MKNFSNNACFDSLRRRGAGFVNDPTEGRALDKSEPRTAQKAAGLSGEAVKKCLVLEFLKYKQYENRIIH